MIVCALKFTAEDLVIAGMLGQGAVTNIRTLLKIYRNEAVSMARFWKERYDSREHENMMWGRIDGVWEPQSQDLTSKDNLLVRWVYFVNVCQLDFQFMSLRQLEVCLDYFRQKNRGSSRIKLGSADHWEVQRWFERLPKGVRREPNRLKIVKALETALPAFKSSRCRSTKC